MIKLEYVPYGLVKINEWFGGCPAHIKVIEGKARPIRIKGWGAKNTKQIRLPFPLRLDTNRTLVVLNPWVHKRIAASLIDALEEIESYAGHEFLIKYNLSLAVPYSIRDTPSTDRSSRSYVRNIRNQTPQI